MRFEEIIEENHKRRATLYLNERCPSHFPCDENDLMNWAIKSKVSIFAIIKPCQQYQVIMGYSAISIEGDSLCLEALYIKPEFRKEGGNFVNYFTMYGEHLAKINGLKRVTAKTCLPSMARLMSEKFDYKVSYIFEKEIT